MMPRSAPMQVMMPRPSVVAQAAPRKVHRNFHGMSFQSWTILTVSIIHTITLLVIVLVMDAFNWITAAALGISIILMAVYVFDTNCLTSGNCNIWSWVRTIFYVIILLLSIWAVASLGIKVKKLKEEAEEDERKRQEEEERRKEYERRRADDEHTKNKKEDEKKV
jgi:type VI protein secretion system component VasK